MFTTSANVFTALNWSNSYLRGKEYYKVFIELNHDFQSGLAADENLMMATKGDNNEPSLTSIDHTHLPRLN